VLLACHRSAPRNSADRAQLEQLGFEVQTLPRFSQLIVTRRGEQAHTGIARVFLGVRNRKSVGKSQLLLRGKWFCNRAAGGVYRIRTLHASRCWNADRQADPFRAEPSCVSHIRHGMRSILNRYDVAESNWCRGPRLGHVIVAGA